MTTDHPSPRGVLELRIVAVLAVVAFVRLAAELLIPIVVGVLVSLALEPVVSWLVRRGLPRGAAAAVLLLALVGSAGGLAYAQRDRLAEAVDTLPTVAQRVGATLRDGMARLGVPGAVAARATGGGDPALATAGVQGAVRFTAAGAGHATVVVFLVFFLLHSGPEMAARIRAAGATPRRRAMIATILTDVNRQVQRFLLVQAIAAVIVALATWLALASVGVRYALLWGVAAGTLNSIPYFGPVVVSGGLFLVGLVQDGGTALAWKMAGAALVITTLEGWLVTPPLLGRAERMNVLTVFLGLLVWTWIWGAWGTLLAVPMLAAMKSVADHVEGLRPLGRLMAA